jgi:hypothetical protein
MRKLALLPSLVGLTASASEKPVVLYKGLGVWKHPIVTANPEAQKFFDQGLALLFGFNRYEAFRSFRKAAELDTKAVMAYWGMAMAQGPYINMDGDPSFDLKGSCMAVDAGRKLTHARSGNAATRKRWRRGARSTGLRRISKPCGPLPVVSRMIWMHKRYLRKAS